MVQNEAGVAINVAPLRSVNDRSQYFLDDQLDLMVDWYYRTSDSDVISIDLIDEQLAVVSIARIVNDVVRVSSFTIGPSQKRQIYHSYTFYHPS